ncbi:serine protease family S33 [Thraustotheca clavata]|uniref:Serine protease family S33 n=1 Tax=Thraustotheca clavata TaxID=74557 RepID=A0A1W0A9B3_9STRA|nr:serine protease family S33 [Thraustotheca clavata]
MLKLALLVLAIISRSSEAVYTINGWYSCSLNSEYSPSSSGSSSSSTSRALHESNTQISPWNRPLDFKLDVFDDYFKASTSEVSTQSVVPECAEVIVPLCYTGICTLTQTMPAFVKRIPASSGKGTKKALWLLQGGPGASSVNMESLMANLFTLLEGKFSIYTMDHRGTGRSLLLDCVASQATAAGSPGGATVTVDELPNCLADINFQYGTDASMFSVTSAAEDLNYIMTNEPTLATSQIYVYGVSYGTYLVERLMHLAPPNVKGYILDSVQAESFPDDSEFAGYYSNWDRDFGEVSTSFFNYCNNDTFCSSQIGPNSQEKLMELYQVLDKNTTQCAQLAAALSPGDPPSWALRKYFASLFLDMDDRLLIAPIIKRLGRCNSADVQVLAAAFNPPSSSSSSTVTYVRGSDLLYDTIVFSEIWQPQPESSLKELFEAQPIASGLYSGITAQYCFVVGTITASANICSKLIKTKGFKYTPPNTYWNQTTSIPENASVLILSGGLDPQTPAKYAKLQYQNMNGTSKLLITFPYAAHAVINSTPVKTNNSLPCGYQVITSFLEQNGDVDKVDLSCQNDVLPLTFEVPVDAARKNLQTTDAFDGSLDPVLSTKSNNSTIFTNQSQVPLIVVSALFGISMLVVLVLAITLRRQQKRLSSIPLYEAPST